MVVLSHMLLSFRHSPQAFHEVKTSSKAVERRSVIVQFSRPYSAV